MSDRDADLRREGYVCGVPELRIRPSDRVDETQAVLDRVRRYVAGYDRYPESGTWRVDDDDPESLTFGDLRTLLATVDALRKERPPMPSNPVNPPRDYYVVRGPDGCDRYEWNYLDEARVEAEKLDKHFPLGAPHRVIKMTVTEEDVTAMPSDRDRMADARIVAARDAEWREAVERLRGRMNRVALFVTWAVVVPRNAAEVRDDCVAALDTLLAAMEAPDAK